MIFDHIEWDQSNLDHARKRRTANGGNRVIVIVVHDGVRPITGWEQ